MVFLDNSSSSFFKPACVINAVKNTLEFIPFNPSRSSHDGALKAGRLVFNTRQKLAAAFNCQPERVLFGSGCTEALNLAIFGTAKKGGHIITTPFEHNAVLRPLRRLSLNFGVKLSFVTSPIEAERAVTSSTYMLIVNHVSNVTGAKADIDGFAQTARRHGLLYLADAAQSAGYIPINMGEMGIDMLALAPHKGLHAMQGAGALLINEGVGLDPFKFGGTGVASSSTVQQGDFPEGFEAGTLPTPAIASINTGLRWSIKNMTANAQKLNGLSQRLIDALQKIKGIQIYSRPNDCGIVAFNLANFTSQEAGDILNERYGIAVRCGFHCAPLLHEYYGTKDGMIRASFGVDSSNDDADYLATAAKEIR